MRTLGGIALATAAEAGERYRLAPVLLARVPLLRFAEAETAAWNEVRALLIARRRLLAGIRRSALGIGISAGEPHLPRLGHQWRALRRAVRLGQRPSAATLRALRGTRSVQLLAHAWQRADDLEARIADALGRAERRDADELAALARLPPWRRALMMARPDVACQLDSVIERGRLARRDRMTLRTARRLAWRAAGKPAPMGLFSGTARLRDAGGASIDQVAEAPRRARVSIRTEALGELAPARPIAPPLEVESLAWQAALSGAAGLDLGLAASRWREAAEAIESGAAELPLTSRDARALWIESTLGRDIEVCFGEFAAAFDTLARLGSDLVCPDVDAAWTAAVGLPPTGRMPLVRLIEVVRASLHSRHGPAAIAAMPMTALLGRAGGRAHGADALVESALASGCAIRAAAAAALGLPAAAPIRAAFRARPVAGATGTALAISHWGGDAMSVLMGYAHLFEEPATARLREWMAGFPGCADVALGTAGIADRQRRLAPRRVTAHPHAPGDIAIGELDAEWSGAGIRLLPKDGVPIISALHPGLAAEAELPFATRLLLHLVRQPRTLVEVLIEATNRAMAARIADWLSEADAGVVLALPAVAIDPGVVLAPPAFVLRGGPPPHDWDRIAAAWDGLDRAGCRLGLAELRGPGALADPRIVDLGSRDGIALALGGDTAFAHLTPLAPAPRSGWLAEFCIELAGR